MAQPLRHEDPNRVFFITTRTIGSRLWFVNNARLEERILAYLAKYIEQFGVVIYAFVLMGNHYHLIAKFPRRNKAAFMRAFNAIVAKLVSEYVPAFRDGKLWARRYSEQVLPLDSDITHWALYCALNAVFAGLARDPLDYPGYNSFYDSITNKSRVFRVFDRKGYNQACRFVSDPTRDAFISEHVLQYERLPEFNECSLDEFKIELRRRFEERQHEAVELWGDKFPSPLTLRRVKPGSFPGKTKKSDRGSFRPLVLSLCHQARREFLQFYFSLLEEYREASLRYRLGMRKVVFPSGTYKPLTFNS